MKHVLLFGISGGIGNAMAHQFLKKYGEITIHAPVRSAIDINQFDLHSSQSIQVYDWDSDNEASYEAIAALKNIDIKLDYCISALGALHADEFKPEKKLGQLNKNQLLWYYNVNAIVHALIIKSFSPFMNKQDTSIMGLLSARVGSISDNKLGGWYSYRAAKAALNMIIKTASIEMKRYNKQLSIIGIHPGTVDTNLSKPFQAHVPEHKLFTPDYSINSIFNHIFETIGPDDSGFIFAYDGQKIPE